MEKETAAKLFESLSSGIRLDIYRLLVKSGLSGMVAGQISTTLNLPSNNISFHLKGMVYAGLISVKQEGRFQRYQANLGLMFDLVRYLTEECCGGHPEKCADMSCTPECVTVKSNCSDLAQA